MSAFAKCCRRVLLHDLVTDDLRLGKVREIFHILYKRRADALVYIGLLYDIASKSQSWPNSVSELPCVGLPYDLSSL